MLSPLFFLCADDNGLGKVNPSNMSEQQLLEILVADMKTRGSFQDDAGDFLDYTQWNYVSCFDSGAVRSIKWRFGSAFDIFKPKPITPNGSIDFQWIPHEVEVFEVQGLRLYGSIETNVLPQNLLRFLVAMNQLTGTFDTARLPSKIEIIHIHSNKLEGPINITTMPSSLTCFSAHANIFSGKLDFSAPPQSLSVVHLQNNRFTSPLRLDGVRSIETLNVQENRFNQDCLRIGMSEEAASGRIYIDKEQFREVVYGE